VRIKIYGERKETMWVYIMHVSKLDIIRICDIKDKDDVETFSKRVKDGVCFT